jgi:two-component system KDP operon response regulator KdpE
MERPLVIIALEDKRLSSALSHLLEAEKCWVRSLAPSEYETLTEIVRRSEPTVLIVDISIATRSLDLEKIPSPAPFSLIVLSAHDGETAVRWLEHGADVFLKYPVSVEEIAAQALALSRKHSQLEPVYVKYVYRGITVDSQDRKVIRDGRSISLSSTEFRLMRALIANAGHVVTHDTLLTTVWGPEYVGDLALLRSFILRLRKKLGDSGQTQTYIQTRGQLGYSVPASERASSRSLEQSTIERVFRDASNLRTTSTLVRERSMKMREESAARRKRYAEERAKDLQTLRKDVLVPDMSADPQAG